jgi:hypothetical protein
MDGHKHSGALTDETLEREVEAILGVDPSPEFLARVRARVAEEPASVVWRSPLGWGFAAAAVMAIGVAAILSWSFEPAGRSSEESSSVPLVAGNTAAPVSAGETARAVPEEQIVDPVRPSPGARGVGDKTAIRAVQPEAAVVVAPEDGRALEFLLASIRKSELVLVLPEETAGPAALSAAGIEILQIDIEPVPPIAQMEGGVE